MGFLQFLGFGGKGGGHRLVVATYEGPNRVRLNGNRTTGPKGKQGAIAHDRTICWIEFSREGGRLDQGTGLAAGKLGPAAVQALLRDLPQNPACKEVLQDLEAGREQAGRFLDLEKWGHFGVGTDKDADPAR